MNVSQPGHHKQHLQERVCYQDLARAYLCQKLPHTIERFLGDDGLFFEQLNSELTPQTELPRRLLVQCRLVVSLCIISQHQSSDKLLAVAKEAFQGTIERYYAGPSKGWLFSLDPHGEPANKERDLYAHTFVLLACAHLFKASNDRLYRTVGQETLSFINSRFRAIGGGFFGALDDSLRPLGRTRRQNPHMHLVEGCLAMFEATGDSTFLSAADEVIQLLQTKFIDRTSSTLREYFDDVLEPSQPLGHIIEPGHHFEWSWLLRERIRVGRLSSESETTVQYKTLSRCLLDKGLSLGWDTTDPGIYDEVSYQGELIKTSKRIWPLMEYVKALVVADPLDHVPLDNALAFAFTHYLNHDRGTWVEHLNRTLTPVRDDLPGSTPYHITVAIGCVLDSKSPLAGMELNT